MYLKQSSGLNVQALEELQRLVHRCEVHDGRIVRVYWTLIDRLRAISGDFCLYSDEHELIAYLGVFLFNFDEAEISAMVDPRFRGRGLFKQLLEQALLLVKPMGLKRLVFCAGTEAVTMLQRHNASFRISEYELRWNSQPVLPAPQAHLARRLANTADLGEIVALDVLCLHDDPDKLYYHFGQHFADSERDIWLLYDDDVFVGKIHVHRQDSICFIHNICIKPELQGRGYGYCFLADLLHELKQAGQNDIRMDVESPNARALSLYQRLGFVIAGQFDFWETSIAP